MSASQGEAACDFCDRTAETAGIRLVGRSVCICQHCVGAATLRLLQAYDLEQPGAVERARAAGRDAALGDVAYLMDEIEGRRARPTSFWQAITGALRRQREHRP